MKNVLLLKGVTPYDAGATYIEEWASVLRKLGCNTCVLDGWSLAMPGWYSYILSKYKFDLVLDCNGNLMQYGAPDNLPPEVIYATYCHDHPGALERLKYVDERTIVFSLDNRFCSYMDKYLPMIKHREFIPLSGSFYPECVPYGERTTDIIFTGSYRDPEEFRRLARDKMEELGTTERRFLEDVMEDIIVNSQYTLQECFSRILEKYNCSVSNYELNELVRNYFVIDSYASAYYRDKMVRTLLEAGLEIHVFGRGWKNFHSEYKERLIIHKGGAWAARKALANAKFALNMMPWFKEGFQERIASAMLSKTIAVTDESVYINDKFENGKELIAFSLKDIESLPGRIKYLLSHPKEAAEIAENGYRKAQSHTWSVRVHDMVRKIEKDFNIGLMKGGGDEGKELELEMEFPDKKTAVAEALYQLQKMVDVAENDVAEINSLSATDSDFLMQKFEKFVRQFSGRIDGMDMSDTIRKSISSPDGDISKEWLDLFSMQCKALIGRLLLEEEGLRI